MGLFSRQKGSREERALVMALRDLKFDNVRRGLCQEEKLGFRPDVIGEKEGREWTFENKSYRDKFLWLYKFLDQTGVPFGVSVGGRCVGVDYSPIPLMNPGFDIVFKYSEETKELKRLFKLAELKKEADFLVIKINNKKRLFIRYWV